ncbi:hypothetical protein FKW77_006901 [Venturia effusa]|uniref:Peptidase S26 domain-containing protein n=1 Tax=Venturia effusa TaxID=50376 RepID=A0A517LKF5_9PEZI|nr:hypothetical protein FKW77_006901 [Venturia effusa]
MRKLYLSRSSTSTFELPSQEPRLPMKGSGRTGMRMETAELIAIRTESYNKSALPAITSPNFDNMLFSQNLLILGALLSAATACPAPNPNGDVVSRDHPDAYTLCLEVQVKLTVDESLKPSAQEKTKIITEAFSIPDPKNSKTCGKPKISPGSNPATGSILKAFKYKQSPTNFKCYGKDKAGYCGLAADLTLSSKNPKSYYNVATTLNNLSSAAMIRTSLRRFYSVPSGTKTKAFALARPIKPRPKPVPEIRPTKTELPKANYTLWEVARATLSPFSKKSQQWQRDLSKMKDADALARTRIEGNTDRQSVSLWGLVRRCVGYSIAILAFGHLFTTHVYNINGTFGPSMLPTLHVEGDWVIVNKLYRRGKGVQVGDLVEARDPLRADGRVLKRIIGMPGDFVLAHTVDTDGLMLQIPLGHCFLAGDNQPESNDSRLYGPVPLALITGKVSYRIRPLGRMGPLENTLQPVDEEELFGST